MNTRARNKRASASKPRDTLEVVYAKSLPKTSFDAPNNKLDAVFNAIIKKLNKSRPLPNKLYFYVRGLSETAKRVNTLNKGYSRILDALGNATALQNNCCIYFGNAPPIRQSPRGAAKISCIALYLGGASGHGDSKK